jgi:hypothetical protein
MSREATFLLALGLLTAAAACVSVTGWILFVRDRRADRAAASSGGAADAHQEAAEEP